MRVPRYSIDLSFPPDQRWGNMLGDSWACKTSKKLIRNAIASAEDSITEYLRNATKGKLFGLERFLGITANTLLRQATSFALCVGAGEEGYEQELRQWATQTGLNLSFFSQGNLSYELSCLCSSVAFYRPKYGMIHARNLDWPLKSMEKGTCLIDFNNSAAGDFTAISIPGFIGVLSGNAKGRFSATINMAPYGSFLTGKNIRGCSAPLLLRFVFENAESFDSAIFMLKQNRTFAPVFFHVTGCKKGESAIIHMKPDSRNIVYKYNGRPLAVTNHSDNFEYPRHTETESGGESEDRLGYIIEAAKRSQGTTMRRLGSSVLGRFPVFHSETKQRMIMSAKTGQIVLMDV